MAGVDAVTGIARFHDVKRLTNKGYTTAQIATQIGVDARTVLRYRAAPPTDAKYHNNLLHMRPSDWEDAACLDHDPELWFPAPRDVKTRRRAQEICNTCPCIQKCLKWALQADERDGVWGGLCANQRAKITGRRS